MTSSSPEDETRQDIKRTRQQLSDTVEALAHKADVPAGVKDKVADTQQTVQVQAEAATQHLLEGTAALQAKAGEVARHADKLPPTVAERIDPLIARARQRPLTAAAVVVGMLWMLRRLLRNSK